MENIGTRIRFSPDYIVCECGHKQAASAKYCLICKRRLGDEGWRKFSPEYWKCECGYHTIARTEYCPECGRKNGREN